MRLNPNDPDFDLAQSDRYRAETDEERNDGRNDGRNEGRDEGRDDGRDDGRPDRATRMARAGSPAHAGVASSWQDIKSRFVDDPAAAIADAEELVQRALDDKIRALKAELEAMTARDGDGPRDGSATEALRMRLINYQSYCDRLAR
jgi:hypothetical protein